MAVAIYGWNRTSSVVPRSRIRAVAALVFGVLEIALLAVGVVAYYHSQK
jgi:hypothetical protein